MAGGRSHGENPSGGVAPEPARAPKRTVASAIAALDKALGTVVSLLNRVAQRTQIQDGAIAELTARIRALEDRMAKQDGLRIVAPPKVTDQGERRFVSPVVTAPKDKA